MNKNYDDIINLTYNGVTNHTRMSAHDRAAQFSPFAALVGHGDAINETARLTDSRPELSEDEIADINDKIRILKEQNHPQISVEYFVPDELKEGGAYVTYEGTLRTFDEYERLLIFDDGVRIAVEEVYRVAHKANNNPVKFVTNNQ